MAARSSLLLSSLAQGLPIALFTFVLCFSVSVILLALMEPWVLRGWARRFLSPERTRPRDTMSVPREQQEEAPQKQGRSITHDRAEGTATRESSGGEWHCDADLGGRGHAQQSMNSTAEESPAAAGRIEHEDVQDQGAYDRIRVSTQHKDLSWTRPDCVKDSKFSRYLAAKAARAARAARNEREKRDGRQERGSAWQAMRSSLPALKYAGVVAQHIRRLSPTRSKMKKKSLLSVKSETSEESSSCSQFSSGYSSDTERENDSDLAGRVLRERYLARVAGQQSLSELSEGDTVEPSLSHSRDAALRPLRRRGTLTLDTPSFLQTASRARDARESAAAAALTSSEEDLLKQMLFSSSEAALLQRLELS